MTEGTHHEVANRVGYHNGPQRKHDWHSGWVEKAAEVLVGK